MVSFLFEVLVIIQKYSQKNNLFVPPVCAIINLPKLGGENLKQVRIALQSADNIKFFLETVHKYRIDGTLGDDGMQVSAASIIGFFCQDWSKPVLLTMKDQPNLADFLEKIKEFVV